MTRRMVSVVALALAFSVGPTALGATHATAQMRPSCMVDGKIVPCHPSPP